MVFHCVPFILAVAKSGDEAPGLAPTNDQPKIQVRKNHPAVWREMSKLKLFLPGVAERKRVEENFLDPVHFAIVKPAHVVTDQQGLIWQQAQRFKATD